MILGLIFSSSLYPYFDVFRNLLRITLIRNFSFRLVDFVIFRNFRSLLHTAIRQMLEPCTYPLCRVYGATIAGFSAVLLVIYIPILIVCGSFRKSLLDYAKERR